MLQKPNGVNISIHKIYSEDGLELDALLFEPAKKTKKIIIHIHGKEGHFIQNHFVTYMGYTYPGAGYAFLTFNNRGHDYMADMLQKASHGYQWTTHGSAYEQIEEAPLDIDGAITYAQSLGYEEIILQGHSLGPHKICYYLANSPKHLVSKVILITTADIHYQLEASVPEWQKYVGVAKLMIDQGQGGELMPIRLWSNGPVSAQTYWHYTRPDSNTWVFNFSVPEIEFRHFTKVRQPMLVIVPENDNANGTPQKKAMEMLRSKTVSSDFTCVIVENAVHNFASKEQELVSEVMKWLKSSEVS